MKLLEIDKELGKIRNEAQQKLRYTRSVFDIKGNVFENPLDASFSSYNDYRSVAVHLSNILTLLVPENIYINKNYDPNKKLIFPRIVIEKYVENSTTPVEKFKDHLDRCMNKSVVQTEALTLRVLNFTTMYDKGGRTKQKILSKAETRLWKEITLTNITDLMTSAHAQNLKNAEVLFTSRLFKHATENALLLLTSSSDEIAVLKALLLLPTIFKTKAKELYSEEELSFYEQFLKDKEPVNEHIVNMSSKYANRIDKVHAKKWGVEKLLTNCFSIEEQIRKVTENVINTKKIEISRIGDTISDYEKHLAREYTRLTQKQAELSIEINTLKDPYITLGKFLDRSKVVQNYEFISHEGGLSVYLDILTPMTNFEPNFAQKLTNNKHVIYTYGTSKATKLAQQLFDEIFTKQNYSIMVHQLLCIDTKNKIIGKVHATSPGKTESGDYNYALDSWFNFRDASSRYLKNKGIRNPHIHRFNCFGTTRNLVQKALNENDIIGAVNVAINSVSNMNLVDSAVLEDCLYKFLIDGSSGLYDDSEADKTKVIKDNNTGDLYTMKEFRDLMLKAKAEEK